MLFELLGSGVSQRRAARLLRIHRITVASRVILFGTRSREELLFETAFSNVIELQFDDMETYEHTKCKPLSVTLAVEGRTRRILGFRVGQMSAKGLLVKKALKKYGPRRDERSKNRKDLFKELQPVVNSGTIIKSDSNPYYTDDVKSHFPDCTHIAYLGKRGAITGQGELKKTVFDPIFSLNHTCAMYRDNLKCLARKTWCTTKKKERLADRLAIYAVYHNRHLKAA
jgi:hypothetical protein